MSSADEAYGIAWARSMLGVEKDHVFPEIARQLASDPTPEGMQVLGDWLSENGYDSTILPLHRGWGPHDGALLQENWTKCMDLVRTVILGEKVEDRGGFIPPRLVADGSTILHGVRADGEVRVVDGRLDAVVEGLVSLHAMRDPQWSTVADATRATSWMRDAALTQGHRTWRMKTARLTVTESREDGMTYRVRARLEGELDRW